MGRMRDFRHWNASFRSERGCGLQFAIDARFASRASLSAELSSNSVNNTIFCLLIFRWDDTQKRLALS
jgi:hypothetical protein